MIELRRKAYAELARWKGREGRKPLIIEGLRQVGKSYVALRFAKENYASAVLFDFRHDATLNAIFDNADGKLSVRSIIEHASLHFPGARFAPGETCLVFDEIGDSPLARESLKLFAQDGGYDVIATGSLLGVGGLSPSPKRNTPVGYEEYLRMTALDFEEFLWACGISEKAVGEIRSRVSSFEEISEDHHRIFSSYLSRYILLGGMPEAVTSYLERGDLGDARAVQRRLLRDYEADFGRKADASGRPIIDATLLIRTSRAYHSIPEQLSRENKKFKYSAIERGGRSSEFSDALEWLSKANVVALAHNLRAVEPPLTGNAIPQEFKVYPCDIGLLMAMFPDAIAGQVLQGDYGAYKGAIYEGLAADMLFKAGFPLFYYSSSAKHREIDFLLEERGGTSILEVKAAGGKAPATRDLIASKEARIVRAYKAIGGNFSQSGVYATLPHYALPFLLDRIKDELRESMALPPLPVI